MREQGKSVISPETLSGNPSVPLEGRVQQIPRVPETDHSYLNCGTRIHHTLAHVLNVFASFTYEKLDCKAFQRARDL